MLSCFRANQMAEADPTVTVKGRSSYCQPLPDSKLLVCVVRFTSMHLIRLKLRKLRHGARPN